MKRNDKGQTGTFTESMFLIGLLLQKNICPNLAFVNYKEECDFACFWYLICLFHDKAWMAVKTKSVAEYRHKNISFRQKHKNLERLNLKYNQSLERLGVTFVPESSYGEKGIRFTNGTVLKQSEVSESQLLDFCSYYRVCRISGKTDHGMLGGLWLYDTLVKSNLPRFAEDISTHELANLYSYLSQCLIVHNMKEKIAGSDYEPFQKVSFSDNPILFLLIIAEVLEPVRFFGRHGMSPEEILNAYSCKMEKGKVYLKLGENLPKFIEYAIRLEKGLDCIEGKVVWNEDERSIIVTIQN